MVDTSKLRMDKERATQPDNWRFGFVLFPAYLSQFSISQSVNSIELINTDTIQLREGRKVDQETSTTAFVKVINHQFTITKKLKAHRAMNGIDMIPHHSFGTVCNRSVHGKSLRAVESLSALMT